MKEKLPALIIIGIIIIAFIGGYFIGQNQHKIDAGQRAIDLNQLTYSNEDMRYIIYDHE